MSVDEKHKREVVRLYELWQGAKGKLEKAEQENALLRAGEGDQNRYAHKLQASYQKKLEEMKDKLQYAEVKSTRMMSEMERLRNAVTIERDEKQMLQVDLKNLRLEMDEKTERVRQRERDVAATIRRAQDESNRERLSLIEQLRMAKDEGAAALRKCKEAETLTRDLRAKLQQKEDEIRSLEQSLEDSARSNASLKASLSRAESIAQESTAELRLYAQQLDHMKSEGTSQEQTLQKKLEELKFELSLVYNDKKRLHQLLKEATSVSARAEATDNAEEAVEAISRPGGAFYVKSRFVPRFLEASSPKEGRNWLPAPLLDLMKSFRDKNCEGVGLQEFSQLVSDIFQVCKQYETERINQLKAKYRDGLKDYKRKLAQSASYDEVMAQREADRLRKQVKSLQKSVHKQEAPSLRTSRKAKRASREGRQRAEAEVDTEVEAEDPSYQIAAGAVWFGRKALKTITVHRDDLLRAVETFEADCNLASGSSSGSVRAGRHYIETSLSSVADTVAQISHLLNAAEDVASERGGVATSVGATTASVAGTSPTSLSGTGVLDRRRSFVSSGYQLSPKAEVYHSHDSLFDEAVAALQEEESHDERPNGFRRSLREGVTGAVPQRYKGTGADAYVSDSELVRPREYRRASLPLRERSRPSLTLERSWAAPQSPGLRRSVF